MSDEPYLVRPSHALSAAEVWELEERLYDYNRQATGYDAGRASGLSPRRAAN